ncbi:hypothetical protein [Bacillus sp. P14.5]|uniref:DUF7948 domain-containing protein n=1 Tax=Bacillus sp. P14.5 TaxID=1983400 RepID=UPI000DEA6448|nr:hypothetical protein [Bacillus sp. P14.5]
MMKNITSGFQVSETDNQMPPNFIKNEGPLDEEKIVYYSKSAGYSVYFTEEGARFVFVGREKGEALADKELPEELIAFRLDFKFLNGDKAIDPVAMGELPGKVNYFRGSDPAKWRTEIPILIEVVYIQVWPGINLFFYGREGKLKYGFLVQPCAKVEDIQFTYEGGESLSIDQEGNLEIETPIGMMIDERPVSFQEKNGRQVQVGTIYKVTNTEVGTRTVSFQVGDDYNPNYLLIIDPGLLYSYYPGGTGSDRGNFISIATDHSGNVYLTRSTNSPTGTFPTVEAFQAEYGGGVNDAFVTRVSPSGSLDYLSYLGESGEDAGNTIVVDIFGNACATGITGSQTGSFPTVTPFQSSYGGGSTDAFVAKIGEDRTITVKNDPGECGAIVDYENLLGVTCNPRSGSFFR